MRITVRSFAGLLSALVWCSAALFTFSAAAADPLLRQNPTEIGVNEQDLEKAFSNAAGLENIHSLVVVRSGSVIGERYWVGEPSTLHDVRSVTKSVLSTLIGIAVDRGMISNIDAPMIDYLPTRYLPLSPEKHTITIRHLLSMTSGLAWDENDDWLAWSTSFDPLRYILSKPLDSPPGERFTYSTAATHILSAILREATGTDVLDFADSMLFGPLGISAVTWQRDPAGYPFGGHGLALTTEDSAKIGVLMFQGGLWQGHRIISSQWIREATDDQLGLAMSYGPFSGLTYGHLWWLDRSLSYDAFWAWGWGGQFIYCVPDLQLVVAANHEHYLPYTQADGQEQAMLHLIVEQIIPAVTGEDSHRRLPEVRNNPPGASPLAGRYLWDLHR